MSIVAKMKCSEVKKDEYGNEHVALYPVHGDCEENKSWSKATPGGRLELMISNPGAQGQHSPGGLYRVTIEAFLLALVLATLLTPSLAFAQDPAAPAAPKSTLELILQWVVAPLVPILFTLAIAALTKLTTYLHAKEKESMGARVASVLVGAAHSVVAELDVTLKPQLQAALADGVLTDTEKARLKVAALEALKTQLPPALLGQASTIFGPLLDQYLGGLVERAVTDRQATEAIGAVRPPRP